MTEIDPNRAMRQPFASVGAVIQELAPAVDIKAGRFSADALQDDHEQAARLVRRLGWRGHRPSEFFDSAIADLPSSLPRYSAHDAEVVLDKSSTNRLKSYLLGHVPADALPGVDADDGSAFTVRDSIRCLDDVVRTKLFLQSVGDAVDRLAQRQRGPIEVLDAGCGGLAVLGVYAALCSPRVRVTALELNPAAVVTANALVDSMGLAKQIRVLQADATNFKPDKPVDLLISETMNSALTDEPIVQVFSNLQRYVRPHGISLPSAVEVLATASPVGLRDASSEYVIIHDASVAVFAANWRRIAWYSPGDQLSEIGTVFRDEDLHPEGSSVAVTSRVHVLGGRVIDLFDSVITKPRFVGSHSHGNMRQLGLSGKRTVGIAYAPGVDAYRIRPTTRLAGEH